MSTKRKYKRVALVALMALVPLLIKVSAVNASNATRNNNKNKQIVSEYRFKYANANGRLKGTCPSCGRHGVFTGVLDTYTGEYLPDHVGICDKINSCGYQYTQKEFFDDNKDFNKSNPAPRVIDRVIPPQKPTEYFDMTIVNKTLNPNLKNYFTLGLPELFSEKQTAIAVDMYKIGATTDGHGMTIFWQIDTENRYRYGKGIMYDPLTIKRYKAFGIKPVHTMLKLYDFNFKQCLFGLHLLNGFSGPTVNIVEAEKTAVIASIAFPDQLWLACGGVQMLSVERVSPLRDKKIILHPDLGAYDKWCEKADTLKYEGFLDVHVMDYLERIATESEREKGYDIADFIVRQRVKENEDFQQLL